MIINASFEVANATVVRQGLETLSDEILKVGRLRLYRIAAEARKKITKQPRRFTGKWEPSSFQQLKYLHFAASKGLIEIPYKRTGAYRRSWKIIKTEDGYVLRGGGEWIGGTGMRTGFPAAVAVGGDMQGEGQSYMHQGRWALIADVVAQAQRNAPEEVRKELGIAAKRLGYKWE
jgi:hypothetical protein